MHDGGGHRLRRWCRLASDCDHAVDLQAFDAAQYADNNEHAEDGKDYFFRHMHTDFLPITMNAGYWQRPSNKFRFLRSANRMNPFFDDKYSYKIMISMAVSICQGKEDDHILNVKYSVSDLMM